MSPQFAHLTLYLRRNSRTLSLFIFLFLLLLLLRTSSPSSSSLDPSLTSLRGESYKQFGGALRQGTFKSSTGVKDKTSKSTSFKIAAVADLDKRSKKGEKEWYSVLLPGVLTRDSITGGYDVVWEEEVVITTKHNEGGRGMELSELTVYDGRLLSFGDRTGIVFEFVKDKLGQLISVPRFILTEGDGDTDKGMKVEWSTVKDGNLYIGSFGKEFTNQDGEVVNRNNMWIVVLDHWGHVKRYDWTDIYNEVRASVGCESPGYLVHEAVLWSENKKKWMFLPRRMSKTAYDDVEDERKGSNVLITSDPTFRDIKTVQINVPKSDGLRGFSTFAFVPGTRDQHAIALRSVEEECAGEDESRCRQRTYAMVFDTDSGEVMMQERLVSENMKFEGVEFVDVH